MPGQTVIPHLNVNDGEAALAFYEKAFGAKVEMKMPAKDGKRLMHASMSLNGGTVMLVDDFPEFGQMGAKSPALAGATTVTIHLDVPDTDSAVDRALKAGATAIMKPDNMFWGQRYGQLKDPFGHVWSLGGPVT
jgi:PhnB protein